MPNDVKLADDFLGELVELCKKYGVTLGSPGEDYGMTIDKYTDGLYHRENEIMDRIAKVNQDGVERG